MQFCEKRYAEKRIKELSEKRDVTKRLGGDVRYFERLILQWEKYRNSL